MTCGTAGCAARILAHKGASKYKPVPDAAFKNALNPAIQDTHSYGMTMIIVNNTIVQQWVDELKKFAPTLNVRTYYGGGSGLVAYMQNLGQENVASLTSASGESGSVRMSRASTPVSLSPSS